MSQKEYELNSEKGTCKYCFGGQVTQKMQVCPFCKEHAPYIPVTQGVKLLLRKGYRLYATRLLADIYGWSLPQAKEHIDNLQIKAEASYASPIDDLIEELAKNSNPMHAIKMIREQSGWGLKEAKEYFELMYYEVVCKKH